MRTIQRAARSKVTDWTSLYGHPYGFKYAQLTGSGWSCVAAGNYFILTATGSLFTDEILRDKLITGNTSNGSLPNVPLFNYVYYPDNTPNGNSLRIAKVIEVISDTEMLISSDISSVSEIWACTTNIEVPFSVELYADSSVANTLLIVHPDSTPQSFPSTSSAPAVYKEDSGDGILVPFLGKVTLGENLIIKTTY